jgi:hypothetical protein
MKKYLIPATVMLLTAQAQASDADFFDRWDQQFREEMKVMNKRMNLMHENMTYMMETMDSFFSPTPTTSHQTITVNRKTDTISLDEKDDGLIINCQFTKKPTEINADYDSNSNQLTVKTATRTIVIRAKGKLLSVASEQHTKKTSKKDTAESEYVAYSSSETTQTLKNPINLEKVSIDYKESDSTLTITLPALNNKKMSKKIPITITSDSAQPVKKETVIKEIDNEEFNTIK